MPEDFVLPSDFESLMDTLPVGSITKAIANHITGINHRQIKTMIPKNRDRFGLVFFTRPQLNLSTNNIKNVRELYPLLTNNPYSIQRFVRCTLDPRLSYGLYNEPPVNTPLVDPLQAFIPVLTNSAISVTGWPGIASPTYTSKEGKYKEQYSQVDGSNKIYNAYTIDANFSNMISDPIIWLFRVWTMYSTLVFEGKMVPYPDHIIYNRIDYNTRIYRLVLSEDMETVTKISSTGASFPLNDPSGEMFDFNTEKLYNSQTDNITIRFQSLGARYLDDIIVNKFNKTTELFNPMMRPEFRNTSMVKIPINWLTIFNNRGYPRINEETYKLEWWIQKEVFAKKAQAISNNKILKETAGV